MGFLDSLLGGDRPERRGPTAAETRLTTAADSLNPERSRLSNVVNQFADSLARGRTAERSDFIGAGAADVAQAFGRLGPATSSSAVLDRGLRRAKGLSRVAQNRGQEFDERLLRDRIAFTRASAGRRGRGLSALGRAAGLSEQLERGVQAGARANEAIQRNTLGTALGIGAGFAVNRFQNRQQPAAPPIGATTNLGTGVFDPTLTAGAA